MSDVLRHVQSYSIQAVAAVAAGVHAFYDELDRAAEGVIGPSQWEADVSFVWFVRNFRETVWTQPGIHRRRQFRYGSSGSAYDMQALCRTTPLLAAAAELNCYSFYGRFRLDSASGRQFVSLAEQIAWSLKAKDAVLDGEIVCLDADGRSQFKSLMYRRRTPHLYAFDILQLNGQDLRSLPLLTRKRHLRRLIPKNTSPLLYVDHVEERGVDLFRLACHKDLEGIVAKSRDGLL